MSNRKLADTNDQIAEKVVGAYKSIEDTVVGAYKSVEEAAVGTYQKVEDHFVDKFFTHEGETVEQAKARMMGNAEAHKNPSETPTSK